MKRLSIKLKITLYFTLIMILLASILLFYTTTISKSVAKNELYETTRASVAKLYDMSHYKSPKNEENFPPNGQSKPENGKRPPLEIDKHDSAEFTVDENAKFTDGDVYLCIYVITKDSSTPIVYGALPEGVSYDISTAKNEQKTELSSGTVNYYVYVKQVRNPGSKDECAWIVGAIDSSLSLSFAHGTLRLTSFALPFIVLFAALLGYAIAKRAFRHVSDITKAASEIAGSNDLSRRIKLDGNGEDEISNLANTFDWMLDTIQNNYDREKQFTDDASHELRTPVSVILAQSELALSPNATDEDMREAMTIINKQGLKMKKLLSELLTLARSDNNKTVLEKETFDLTELAEMIIEEENYISQSKNIDVTLVSKEPVEVFADRTAIMRVLINFINNAIKYGNEGGYVEVSIERFGESGAKCTVKDNGIGISEADLTKIWDRFFRVDKSRTDNGYSSTGLGLPMAKSIVEAHGGTVRAESVLGLGSVFEFTI